MGMLLKRNRDKANVTTSTVEKTVEVEVKKPVEKPKKVFRKSVKE